MSANVMISASCYAVSCTLFTRQLVNSQYWMPPETMDLFPATLSLMDGIN